MGQSKIIPERSKTRLCTGKAAAIFPCIRKKKKTLAIPEVLALTAASFALGAIIGFLISPAKAGFGNNIDNSTSNYYFGPDLDV